MRSLGVKIDKNEITTLVNELKIVETLQKQIEGLNVKMTLIYACLHEFFVLQIYF